MATSNPILKNFPPEITYQTMDVCKKFYETKCCHDLIYHLNITDDCMKLFAAKTLGYGIIVGASAVKLPQVWKIFSTKSGAGITVLGVILELLAITFNASYSFRRDFPFSAWGEAIFLAIETGMIAFLVLYYSGKKLQSFLFSLLYGILVYALLFIVSVETLWWLQSTVLPMSVIGKSIQIMKNYKAGHTGQISAVTAWSILIGSLARVLTTLQETGDMLTAVTFACSSAANAVIALQIVYYWKATTKHLEMAKKKKKN